MRQQIEGQVVVGVDQAGKGAEAGEVDDLLAPPGRQATTDLADAAAAQPQIASRLAAAGVPAQLLQQQLLQRQIRAAVTPSVMVDAGADHQLLAVHNHLADESLLA